MKHSELLSYFFRYAGRIYAALILVGCLLSCGQSAGAQCYTFSGYASPSGAPVSLSLKLTNLGVPGITSFGFGDNTEVAYNYPIEDLSGNTVSFVVGDVAYLPKTFSLFDIQTDVQTVSGSPFSTLIISIFGNGFEIGVELLNAKGDFFPNGLVASLPPLTLFSATYFTVDNPMVGLTTITSITNNCYSSKTTNKNNKGSDFDGDGKADYAVWRPSNGTWYTFPSGGGNALVRQWGLPGDMSATGDYDGDGKTDYAVWRPSNGTWYVIPSSGGNALAVQWGVPGDVPVAGDYDGDGKTDYAVWRPSNGTWYIFPSGGGDAIERPWGLPGDIPVPGDYDGAGKTDFAVYRPTTGTWYVIPSGSPLSSITQPWGLDGDVPVAGDYDGDGKTDFAVWRPSVGIWYVILSSDPAVPTQTQWGLPGDTPVPADYDGDAKSDFTVWRPSNGMWYVIPSAGGNAIVRQWGLPGDVPK